MHVGIPLNEQRLSQCPPRTDRRRLRHSLRSRRHACPLL
jgi:hypothetical protein